MTFEQLALCIAVNFGHFLDMLMFDLLLKPPQPFTGLFFKFVNVVVGLLAMLELPSRKPSQKLHQDSHILLLYREYVNKTFATIFEP